MIYTKCDGALSALESYKRPVSLYSLVELVFSDPWGGNSSCPGFWNLTQRKNKLHLSSYGCLHPTVPFVFPTLVLHPLHTALLAIWIYQTNSRAGFFLLVNYEKTGSSAAFRLRYFALIWPHTTYSEDNACGVGAGHVMRLTSSSSSSGELPLSAHLLVELRRCSRWDKQDLFRLPNASFPASWAVCLFRSGMRYGFLFTACKLLTRFGGVKCHRAERARWGRRSFFFFFLPLGVMNESPRIELTCATGLIESSGQIDGLIEYWGYETEHWMHWL